MIGTESAADGESLDITEALVRVRLDRLAQDGVPAEGHVLLHAPITARLRRHAQCKVLVAAPGTDAP